MDYRVGRAFAARCLVYVPWGLPYQGMQGLLRVEQATRVLSFSAKSPVDGRRFARKAKDP